jgi:hypothetical protein
VTVLAGDGAAPGSLYWRDYGPDGDPSGNDWLYIESGKLPGLQGGNPHVVLGATWGHEHDCQVAGVVAADRDFLIY